MYVSSYDRLLEIALGLPTPKYWDRIMDLGQFLSGYREGLEKTAVS